MNRRRSYCRSPWLFTLVASLALGSAAQAGVRHYILIFASQTHPKIPRFTHTFCTIVRVVDAPPGCPGTLLEAHTISWLPQIMIIHPYRFRAEPGHNFTLEETLRWSAQHRMDVSLWGPYLIEEDFYWKVRNEHDRFERGEYLYRAIDSPRRDEVTSDCIHAVTDVDQRDGRRTFHILRSGDAVTYKFVSILNGRGRLFLPPEDVSGLMAALGLDVYPLCVLPMPLPRFPRR